jgi:hypothetical protein
MRRLGFLISMSLIGALASVSTAFAASPSQVGYGGTAGGVQSGLAQSTPAGTLPFTGLNLAAIAIACALVLAVGLVLRRQRGSNG